MTTVEPPQIAEKSVTIREATQPFYIEGYHRPDYRDPDDSVYDAITDIFSNGRTARLYRSLSETRRSPPKPRGSAAFPATSSPDSSPCMPFPFPATRLNEMRTAIHKELDRLKNEDVTDEELARFKTRARADLLRGLADNEGLAHQLAEYQTRYGDWRELFRQLEKINAVNKADVRRVANKIFIDSNRTSARIEFVAPQQKAPTASMLTARDQTNRTPEVRNEDTEDFETDIRDHAFALCVLPILFIAINLSAQTPLQRSRSLRTSPQPNHGRKYPSHRFTRSSQSNRSELNSSNGLVIFLQEDHELPFINGTILIRGGSRDEPDAKVGLVSLYGETWRTSGTRQSTATSSTISWKPKLHPSKPPAASPPHRSRWSSLKGDFDTVFASTIDLLLHPNFKADKLQLAKRQLDTGIARRNDDASGIAIREAVKLAYGPQNPYARQPEYATVDAVTLDDLKAWHDRTVVPTT